MQDRNIARSQEQLGTIYDDMQAKSTLLSNLLESNPTQEELIALVTEEARYLQRQAALVGQASTLLRN